MQTNPNDIIWDPPVATPVTRPAPIPPRKDRQQADKVTELDIRGKTFTNQKNALTVKQEIVRDKLLGGGDPRETEQRNVGLATGMIDDMRRIQEQLKKVPEAWKPGVGETIADGLFGNTLPGKALRAATANPKTQEARQIIQRNLRSFTQRAIYSASGAAFQPEEFERTLDGVAPDIFDTPGSLLDKQDRAVTEIKAALQRSGAGQLQIDEAVRRFYLESAPIYRPDMLAKVDTSKGPEAARAQIEELYQQSRAVEKPLELVPATGLTKAGTIPPEAQAAFNAQIAKIERGSLTLPAYIFILNRVLAENMPNAPQVAQDDPAAKAWVEHFNNPRAGEINTTLQPASVPTNAIEGTLSEGLDNPVAAGIGNYLNSATLGAIDRLGDGELSILSRRNPKSAMAGDILGAITPVMGMEAGFAKGLAALPDAVKAYAPVLTRGGTATALAADLGANAAYGVGRGAMENDGSALGGGIEGVASALMGRGIAKGARGFLPTEAQQALDALAPSSILNPRGTNLTTMQRMGAGHLEEAFRDTPGVMGAVSDSIKSYGTRNLERAMARIGQKLPVGEEAGMKGNAVVHQALSNEYDRILPQISGSTDKTWNEHLANLRQTLVKKPEQMKLYREEVLPMVQKFTGPNGQLSGEGYREAVTRLRALKENWLTRAENQGDTAALDMAREADEMIRQMRKLVERNDPKLGGELKKVESGWAHLTRIEGATNRATQNQGIYSPGQYAQEVKMQDTSIRRNKAAQGKAFEQDYALAGQKILGSKTLPENINVLKSLGLHFLTVGGAAAAGAPLYTPGVKQVVQAILTAKRPIPEGLAEKAVRQGTTSAIRNYISGD